MLIRRNPASPDHDILEAFTERWSARAFDNRPIPSAVLIRLFEAARWAPSAGNEQPWRFVVARPEDGPGFSLLLSALKPSNQSWATRAQALGVAAAHRFLRRSGDPNKWSWYDAGQAMAFLSIQATVEGLIVHQMAGYDAERMRVVAEIPNEFEPVTAFALGYPGDPATLDEFNVRREGGPRSRRPVHESLFLGRWDQPFPPSPELP